MISNFPRKISAQGMKFYAGWTHACEFGSIILVLSLSFNPKLIAARETTSFQLPCQGTIFQADESGVDNFGIGRGWEEMGEGGRGRLFEVVDAGPGE